MIRRTAAWCLAASLTASLLLAGCAAPQAAESALASQPSNHWSGRLGLLVEQEVEQQQSFSASFELQGSAERGQLEIFNPLGSQVARLSWTPGAAQLLQGSQITESTSLQELVRRSLGTDIPVPALFAWLQGQDQPVAGWSVDLSRHAEGRITAQRRQPKPEAQLRLVLDRP